MGYKYYGRYGAIGGGVRRMAMRMPSLLLAATLVSPRHDADAHVRIGRNMEQLQEDTHYFFHLRTHTPRLVESVFRPDVELCIQNAPDSIIFRTHGLSAYRRTFRVLRCILYGWYVLRFRNLQVHIFPVLAPPSDEPIYEGVVMEGETVIQKLRWRVEGHPRWRGGGPSTGAVPILSGYSYYYFEKHTGRVYRHIVDRLLPPATREGWIWWWLEWLRSPMATSPKPLVDSNGTTPQA